LLVVLVILMNREISTLVLLNHIKQSINLAIRRQFEEFLRK